MRARTSGSRTSDDGPCATIRRLTVTTFWKRWAAPARSWVVATTVLPGPRLRVQDLHEVLLGGRVDAGHGFVEQVEVRIRGERPRQEDASALAAGQSADLGRLVAGHPDHARARRRRHGGRGAPGRRHGPRPRVPAHHHHVADGHRERPVDQLRLGHVGDPPGVSAGGVAEDLDATLPGRQQTRP